MNGPITFIRCSSLGMRWPQHQGDGRRGIQDACAQADGELGTLWQLRGHWDRLPLGCLLTKQPLASSGLQAAGGPGPFPGEHEGNHLSCRLDDALISPSAEAYKTSRDHLLKLPHLVRKKTDLRAGQAVTQGCRIR